MSGPRSKVVLYHFSTDTLVPAQNTVDLLTRLQNTDNQFASLARGDCRESSALTRLVLRFSKSPLTSHTLCAFYQMDDMVADL